MRVFLSLLVRIPATVELSAEAGISSAINAESICLYQALYLTGVVPVHRLNAREKALTSL
jgi:hypothetical protein